MDRSVRALEGLNLDGLGFEVAPSYNPICPKKNGYNVETLDVLSKEGLIAQYENDSNVKDLIGNIETVDYVWHGESYPELIGDTKRYDYIVAAHVIEHQVDLIAWLNDLSAILKDDGIISLIIPDSRYEFDFFREPTSIREVIDVHDQKRTTHSKGKLIDHFLNQVYLEGGGTLIPTLYAEKPDKLRTFDTDEIGRALAQYEMSSYVDCHGWVFTPATFRILVYELRSLGLIDLEIDSMYLPSALSLEFFVKLKKAKVSHELDASDHKPLLDLHLARKKELFDRYKGMYFLNNLNLFKRVFIYGVNHRGAELGQLLESKGAHDYAFISEKRLSLRSLIPGVHTKHEEKNVYALKEVRLSSRDLVILSGSEEESDRAIEAFKERGFDNYIAL